MSAVLDDPGFRTGLGAGLAVVALLATVAAVARGRFRPLPFPLAGVGLVAAGLLAATIGPDDRAWPASLQQAVALATIGGLIATIGRFPGRLATAAAYAPAGLRLAVGPAVPGAPGWAPLLAAAVVVGGGVAIAETDRRLRPIGATLPLFAATVGGAYSTLPDTEHVLVLLGVALPFAAVAVPRAWEAVGTIGAGAITTWFAWVVWIDGRGRPGAMVGAVAALAILVAEPIARRIPGLPARLARQVPRRVPPPVVLATLVAIQSVLALVAGRIAGFEESPLTALLLAIPVLLVAGVVGAAIPPTDRPPRLPRPSDDRYRR